MPGNVLLSHALRQSTIGAEGLDFRVRNGIGYYPFAIITRLCIYIIININCKQIVNNLLVKQNFSFIFKIWWARQELNLRPLRCQRSVLPLNYMSLFLFKYKTFNSINFFTKLVLVRQFNLFSVFFIPRESFPKAFFGWHHRFPAHSIYN